MPKVTIITSTFNRADRFLPQAIESVLKQTYQDWELIVADDCSTDNTKEVVAAYIAKDPRISYFSLPKNHGKDTRPKNQAVLKAQGEYIAFLDDDCEFHPAHVGRLVEEIEARKVDLVYSDMLLIDAAKKDDWGAKGVAMDFDPQILMHKNFIDMSEVLFKKDAIFRVGGFDETLPRFVDWNLWVRMTKAGVTFERVPEVLTKYYTHENNTAHKHPVKMWRDPVLGIMFEPTFDPAGCYIYLPYLGNDREGEKNPKVAIYTISYDRKEYTQKMWEYVKDSGEYPFDWFVYDNGSQDGSVELLNALKLDNDNFKLLVTSEKNKGITIASNVLVDAIMKEDYQIVIKVDNDCQMMTKGWLSTIVDLWKRNHKLYVSPYVEGLVDNPGGAHRVGTAYIGPYMVEVTQHIGGIFAAIDSSAYKEFRWTDQFLHGNQDAEASRAFRELNFMPCYIPIHRVLHMDTTEGQHQKFPAYFERRKKEKTQTYD